MGTFGVDIHPVYQAGYNFIGPGGLPKPGFAWVKVSDGSRPYTKALPDTLIQRAKNNGVPVGGYHWAQPVSRAGISFVAQTDVLLKEIERLQATGVVPALDIEDDDNQHIWGAQEARDFITAFVRRCFERRYRPGVYMNDAMALKLGRSFMDGLYSTGAVLWIARYAKDGVTRLRPNNTSYDVHQYSSTNPSLDKNEAFNNKHLSVFTAGGDNQGEEDDMDNTQDQLLREIHLAHFGTGQPIPGLEDRPGDEAQWEQITDIQEKVTALASGPTAPAEPLDYAKLAKALLAELANPTA